VRRRNKSGLELRRREVETAVEHVTEELAEPGKQKERYLEA
jgi:hypothetical protein